MNEPLDDLGARLKEFGKSVRAASKKKTQMSDRQVSFFRKAIQEQWQKEQDTRSKEATKKQSADSQQKITDDNSQRAKKSQNHGQSY